MENIFTKIFKGEQAAAIGVNVSVKIDNETLIRLCIMILIVVVISLLISKLL